MNPGGPGMGQMMNAGTMRWSCASDTAVAVNTFSDAAAVTGPLLDGVGDVASDASAPMQAGSDAQHLMHLIGACLAVLAAGALFVLLFSQGRSLLGSHPAVTALPRLVTPPPGRNVVSTTALSTDILSGHPDVARRALLPGRAAPV
jgi:hypothetical protein